MAMQNNDRWTLGGLVTIATTIGEAIKKAERAWEQGQIARQKYERIREILVEAGDRGNIIYGELRQTLNELYAQGRREIMEPYEQARRQRELVRLNDRKYREQANGIVTTQAPKQAPKRPIATIEGQGTLEEWTRPSRRNPATLPPETPNPTPTPRTLEPSTTQQTTGKSHYSICDGTNKR